MALITSARAAEASVDARGQVGGRATVSAEVSADLRDVVANFQTEREALLAAQKEVAKSMSSTATEARAEVREELARSRQEFATLRRNMRESILAARDQAREQARRIEVEARVEARRGRE
jgi:hypothetical protein